MFIGLEDVGCWLKSLGRLWYAARVAGPSKTKRPWLLCCLVARAVGCHLGLTWRYWAVTCGYFGVTLELLGVTWALPWGHLGSPGHHLGVIL